MDLRIARMTRAIYRRARAIDCHSSFSSSTTIELFPILVLSRSFENLELEILRNRVFQEIARPVSCNIFFSRFFKENDLLLKLGNVFLSTTDHRGNRKTGD